MQYLILFVLWCGFCFLHSLLISHRVTDRIIQFTGVNARYYRFFYNLFALISFTVPMWYAKQIAGPWVLYYPAPWMPLQYSLMVLSVGLVISAFLIYNPLEFLGIAQILQSGQAPSTSKHLYIRGASRLVRHPMYLATLVILWTLNATTADLVGRVVLTIYVFIGTLLEEKRLVAEFGNQYREYQKRVPMLIPFLKLR